MTEHAQFRSVDSYTIITFAALPEDKLRAVELLAKKCSIADGYESPIYWESIKARKNPWENDILCYDNDKLIAYLALYYFEAGELEITLVVDPDYRTEALYSTLFNASVKAGLPYGAFITTIVIVHEKDVALKHYLIAQGASSQAITYKLALSRSQENIQNIEKLSGAYLKPCVIREALFADHEALIALEVDCFQTDPEHYQTHLLEQFENPENQIFVITKDDEILGKVHACVEEDEAFIGDLCVFTKMQRQGLGQALLSQTIINLFHQGMNKLFLDTSSPEYLQWYLKFNFQCIAKHEHWTLRPGTHLP